MPSPSPSSTGAPLSSPAPLSRSIHLRLLTCPDCAASFTAGSRAAAAFSLLCSPWHDDSAPPDREVIQLQNSTRREGVPADRWHSGNQKSCLRDIR
ncbi:unnamed protein product [Urochloa humidicola]